MPTISDLSLILLLFALMKAQHTQRKDRIFQMSEYWTLKLAPHDLSLAPDLPWKIMIDDKGISSL